MLSIISIAMQSVILIVGDLVFVIAKGVGLMHIEGEGVCIDANGNRHSIAGIGGLPESGKYRKLKVSGNITFKNISAIEVKLEGDSRGESIKADELSAEGIFKVNEVSIINRFELSGTPNIGCLTARSVDIESRDGFIKKTRCEHVKIYHHDSHGGGILGRVFGYSTSKKICVTIGEIEANDVDLQNCQVDEIRCENATIGTNCVIKLLIVKGNCDIASEAKVDEVIRKII